MVALGSVKDRDQIKRYLNHIGLDPDPPPMAPARSWQESLDFDQSLANRYEDPTACVKNWLTPSNRQKSLINTD
jgi:hypothetical protein